MTPDEQRIAIAEACGWVRFPAATAWPVWSNGIQKASIHNGTLPDYLNDLNAMHDAVMLQSRATRMKINSELMKPLEVHAFCLDKSINATAAQRAEAFLRALGKWTD